MKMNRIWFLAGTFALCTPGQTHAAEPRLQLHAEAALCAEAQINGQGLARGADQNFPSLTLKPGIHRLRCGAEWDLVLPEANSTLEIRLRGKQPPEFFGNAAALNALLHAPLALGVRQLYGDLKSAEAAFVIKRERLHAQDLQRLKTLETLKLPQTLLEVEQVRTAFNHAATRIALPYFRWRETDATQIQADPLVPDLVKALPIEDPRWWSLDSFKMFSDAWLHESARALLASDAVFQQGDHRWLRASLASVERLTTAKDLRQSLRDALVLKHLDEDSSIGMQAILAAWQPTASSAAQEKAKALIADEASQTDHAAHEYQTIAGTPLRLHVLPPLAGSSEITPAVLWFHGGSSTEGAWWHMPIIAKALREQGVTVIGVELTTQNRFDRDADQLRDAEAAWIWIKQHATELNLDPKRLGVAGFSSGATLALTTATRGFFNAEKNQEWPAMAIVMGACADPLAKEEDGWFRKSMQGKGDPRQFTPMGNLKAGLPPVLAIHGTADEYCSWETMQEFAERSQALGNDIRVQPVESASHFFVFYHRPGITAARQAIQEQLLRLNWISGNLSPKN